jgi:hypothetical protein
MIKSLLMTTCSGYEPGQTWIVDPAGTELTACPIVGYDGNDGLQLPTATFAAIAERAEQTTPKIKTNFMKRINSSW